MSDDDQDDIVRHFREMVEKLQRYRRAAPPEEMAPHVVRRRRQIGNQMTIAAFLKATGFDDFADDVVEVATDLSELDRGRRNPVHTPAAKGSGRQVDRYDTWMIRWGVADGLKCLIRADQSEETEKKKERDAARYIARNYPIFERLLVARKPTEKESGLKEDSLARPIMSWRKSLTSKNVKEKAVQDAFNDNRRAFLDTLGKLGPEACKALAAELLAKAAKRAEALVISSDLDK